MRNSNLLKTIHVLQMRYFDTKNMKEIMYHVQRMFFFNILRANLKQLQHNSHLLNQLLLMFLKLL